MLFCSVDDDEDNDRTFEFYDFCENNPDDPQCASGSTTATPSVVVTALALVAAVGYF